MKAPVIVFRTEGSTRVGLGHLRRSLTLAHELKKQGAGVNFVVNQDPLPIEFLRKYDVEAAVVEERDTNDLHQTMEHAQRWDARALVVDSYAVSGECLAQVRGPVVAVIDDLADRPLPVDLVINGVVDAHRLAYQTRPGTRLLLGPEYILLREEFAREPKRPIRERIERVLITVGGMDPFVLSPRLIAWTREALGDVAVDVIVGPFFGEQSIAQIERMAREHQNIRMHSDPPAIRDVMLACDLAVTAGGQTTYELAATGTPAVAIRSADNQTGNLAGLSAKGALAWVGDVRDDDLRGKVVKAVADLSAKKDRRQDMSRSGRLLVDGLGAPRVARAIVEACA